MPNIKGCKKADDLQEILDNLYPNTYHVKSSSPKDKGCEIRRIIDRKGGWTIYRIILEFKSNMQAYEKVFKKNINPETLAIADLFGKKGAICTGRDEAQKVVDYLLAAYERSKFSYPEIIRKDIERMVSRCREYMYSRD